MRQALLTLLWPCLLASPVLALPLQFFPPVPVAELNTAHSDRNPTLSPDGLEVFFISTRAGGVGDQDIWRATRADPYSPFGTPVNLAEVNTPGREASPSLSANGLVLYWALGWTGHTESFDIYAATRPDISSPFGAPAAVTEVNSAGSDGSPRASADGLALYLVHNAEVGPPREDLYVATRDDPGDPFGTPVRIDELSTDDMERSPWVSADGLSMYFVSNRAGTHFGDYDIFLTERTASDQPWGAPTRLSGVRSVENDGGPYFDEPSGLLFLSSNGFYGGHGGNEAMDIYVAQAVPEPATSSLLLAGFAATVAIRRRSKRRPHTTP